MKYEFDVFEASNMNFDASRCEGSPQFLKIGTAEESFQHEGKLDSERQRLNNFDKIEENSGAHCFNTTTGISSRSGAFDVSRPKIIFETNLGV